MFVYTLFVHYVADFILQSRYVAENKSSNIKVLATHIGIYTAALALALLPAYFNGWNYVFFIVLNGLAHFSTDFCTSKTTSYFWQHGYISLFWHTIGFDQFLHLSVLYLTTLWLL